MIAQLLNGITDDRAAIIALVGLAIVAIVAVVYVWFAARKADTVRDVIMLPPIHAALKTHDGQPRWLITFDDAASIEDVEEVERKLRNAEVVVDRGEDGKLYLTPVIKGASVHEIREV